MIKGWFVHDFNIKTHWKMKAGTLKLIFSESCGSETWVWGQWAPIIKKLDSLTLETSKNHLIRNFLLNRRVRVKISRLFYNAVRWFEWLHMIPNRNFVYHLSFSKFRSVAFDWRKRRVRPNRRKIRKRIIQELLKISNIA